MAKPDVRMNYESMEKMARAFNYAAYELFQSIGSMKKIVQMLEGGALLGKGGSAFADAVQSQLIPSMQVLHDKCKEMEGDIEAAVKFTRDGVESARSKFF
jgi:hypothetical protein